MGCSTQANGVAPVSEQPDVQLLAQLDADLEADASLDAAQPILALAAHYLTETRQGEGAVSTWHSAHTIADRLEAEMPRRGRPLADVARRLVTTLLEDVNRLAHPMYIGHQVSAPLPAAVWTDALISALNAVTLKPAQCALWLRPPSGKRKNWFYRGFNHVYGYFERGYTWVVRRLVRRVALVLVAFTVLVAFAGWWYTRVPTGFLPTEDQGYLFVSVQLPDAASQERTKEVMRKVDDLLREAGLPPTEEDGARD